MNPMAIENNQTLRCSECGAPARPIGLCRKHYQALRYIAHKEENPQLIARKRETSKAWTERNPDKSRANSSRWRRENPAAYARLQEDYRARWTGQETRLSKDITERLLVLQKGRCAGCRERLVKIHHDHIMPLARGGSHTDDNIQLLCPHCNNTKHALHPVDWAQRNGRLL
jgi:5-methylcytosine-specific restriction endonuclease McrA